MTLSNKKANPLESFSNADLYAAGLISRRSFMALMAASGVGPTAAAEEAEQARHLVANQQFNRDHLLPSYDFVICGAGSSGCVIASKLASSLPNASVLLLEAGGTDDLPAVRDPLWFKSYMNPELYWLFEGLPARNLNGRRPPLPMGRAIGGGSSVNAMIYARGHKADYDGWANQLNDPKWSYKSVVEIFREIENYRGPASPLRGSTGPFWSEITQDVNDCAVALKAAGPGVGLPQVDDINAETMERDGGIGHTNLSLRNGERSSVARSFLYPVLGLTNLTVISRCNVQKIIIESDIARGVRVLWKNRSLDILARTRVVLSTGALKTPQLLMLSGIGAPAQLKAQGIKTVADVPGVGRNFHDHPVIAGCVYENATEFAPRSNGSQTSYFANVNSPSGAPDLMPVQLQFPFISEVNSKRSDIPSANLWTIAPGLAKPRSRGKVTLKSASALDHPIVHTNFLSDPHDFQTLRLGIEQARQLANSPEMRPFIKREIMPGPIKGHGLDEFIRNSVYTYFHMSGTAKMGVASDPMAVVDSNLAVRGVQNLSVADTSIFPDIPRANTMVPAVVVGWQMAKILSS